MRLFPSIVFTAFHPDAVYVGRAYPRWRRSTRLVAVMDWASRKVLAWRLSNTMDAEFCVEALKEALARFGRPEIFNTDQGSQFTSADFTDVLRDAEVRISMDGRGRWMDNVFIERLWRSLKYECVYLNAFETGVAGRARSGLARCSLASSSEQKISWRRHSSFVTLLRDLRLPACYLAKLLPCVVYPSI